jgi:hypothetical protein
VILMQDLSSANTHDILLALHTIIKIPSEDLRPAVEPLLLSKTLLLHDLLVHLLPFGGVLSDYYLLNRPAIRHRTLQAVDALHSNAREYPLSMIRLLKLLRVEEDGPVIAALFRLIRQRLDVSVGLSLSDDMLILYSVECRV